MLSAGIEPTISAGERTQLFALDRAGTGLTEGNEVGRESDIFVKDINKEQSIGLRPS
jgi:hypothetical protein